jgi:hypothetical protein
VVTISRTISAIALAAGVLSSPLWAWAYETDQFYNRSQPIADSTDVLNRKVNETLAEIVYDWDKGEDHWAFVNAIYKRLGGRHWVDKLERWAMKSPEVEKLETSRYQSIYGGMPFWSTRATFFFGIGSTIRVNDELIGSDKIGHFLSQGRKYYRRYLKSRSEAQAAEHSAYTERAIFGRGTTGSYSNADLVANYEGHRFYRSLFEDDIIPGKPAILRWEDDGWVIQRDFDWADHVNAYWDEALNINRYDDLIYKHIRKRIVGLCPQYWEDPSLYTIDDEAALKARYSHLQLHDSWHLKLDNLCPSIASQQDESALAVGGAPGAGDQAAE